MAGAAKLTVLSEVLRGHTFELTEEHYGVGRGPDMDIQIQDPTISTMHCELIRNEDGTYTVVDEGYSTNGTRINGMIVTRQVLKPGDILQIGGVECMFEADVPTEIEPLTSTDTCISISEETLSLNELDNVAPPWWHRDNPHFSTIFKSVIAILTLSAIALIIFLIIKITSVV